MAQPCAWRHWPEPWCHPTPHSQGSPSPSSVRGAGSDKQAFEDIEITATKITDAAVIRLLDGGEYPKSQDLVVGVINLAGRDDANALSVEQKQGRHPWVKALLQERSMTLAGIRIWEKSEFIHQNQQEVHRMVVREQVAG